MASDQSGREAATGATGTHAGASSQAGGQAGQYVPRQAPRYGARDAEPEPSAAAMGFTMMAAVLLMLSGAWNILEGLAAVIRNSYYYLSAVNVKTNYTYYLSVRGWGWFHLIMGAVVLAAGIGLLTDKAWARAVGVAVAAISAIVNFLYIPYYPVWSITIIAIDAVIIWALLTPRHGYRY